MGLGKAVAGALFGTGLMLVVIAGADLFTGNCLIMMSVLERKTRVVKMLLNWLFITAGFEHSVATMYYITCGLLAKTNARYVEVAENAFHVTSEKISHLTVENFLMGNLLPVTIGNIIGGASLIGGIYWFLYVRKH